MLMTFRSLVALLALSLFVNISAHAALIDLGDFSFDTVGKRSWLKVTETSNMSFNQVSAELGAGGAFNGWRFATVDDFESLLQSLELSPAYFSWWSGCNYATYCGPLSGWTDDYSDDDYRAFINLVEALGDNGSQTIYPYPQAQGYLADIDPTTGNRRQGYLGIDGETIPPCAACAFGGIYEGLSNDDYAVDYIGSFLIQEGLACQYGNAETGGAEGRNNQCRYFRVDAPGTGLLLAIALLGVLTRRGHHQIHQ